VLELHPILGTTIFKLLYYIDPLAAKTTTTKKKHTEKDDNIAKIECTTADDVKYSKQKCEAKRVRSFKELWTNDFRLAGFWQVDFGLWQVIFRIYLPDG
jgi:hypothetical protein